MFQVTRMNHLEYSARCFLHVAAVISQVSRSGFLNLSSWHLGLDNLCCGSVSCVTGTEQQSIPDFYLLDASSIPHSPIHDNQKRLQTLRVTPGAEIAHS